jgi:ubiquinone biosynthesis protein
MNVLLACLTLAFFRALVAAGIERDYAIELVSDAAWKVYEKWGALARLIARGLARDALARLRWCVNLFLRFPFNGPGYIYERPPTPDAVDVTIRRCPVAEYLRAKGAPDLCVGSWCNLDYGLAEMWGGRLQRTGTLAGGQDHCDFRFSVAT